MLDKAKITYHSLLKDDDSNARAFAPRETQKTDGVILSEGWALKAAKKSARFNEAQKKYLEEKFNIEQRTGHKQNPEHVVKDVRFAKKKKRQFEAILERRVPNHTADAVFFFKIGI